MLNWIPTTAGAANSGIMMSSLIIDTNVGYGSTSIDAPQARRFRARSGQIGGFRRDIYAANDLAIPMPVKAENVGIRIADDQSSADVVRDLQNIGWKQVSVSDAVPAAEFVAAVPVPINVNVSDDTPASESRTIQGAQLTVQIAEQPSGITIAAANVLTSSLANTTVRSVFAKVPGNTFLLAVLQNAVGGAGTTVVPTIDGLGLVWTQLISLFIPGGGHRMTVWSAVTTSEVAGAINARFEGSVLSAFAVLPFAGVDTVNPIRQTKWNLGASVFSYTPPALDLPVQDPSSIVSMIFSSSVGPLAPGSDFISLVDLQSSFVLSFARLGVAWRRANDDTSTVWTGGSGGGIPIGAFSLELAAVPGPGESVTGVVPNSYESFDTGTALEGVTVHVGTNPAVWDDSGPVDPLVLIDWPIIALSPIPSVSDTLTKTESVTLAFNPLLLTVFDTDTVGDFVDATSVPGDAPVVSDVVSDALSAKEAVTIWLGTGSVFVSDTELITESVAFAYNPPSTVVPVSAMDFGDTTQVQESVTLQFHSVGLSIVVFESDAPTEFAAIDAHSPFIINVFDDNTFPPLDPPPMPATGIARDYIDVQEGLGMGMVIPVVASETVSETDVVTASMVIPVMGVDSLSVVDAIGTDAVTINPVLVGFNGVVVDALAPTDAASVVRVVVQIVHDDVAPTDGAVVALFMQTAVSDTLVPADAVDVRSAVQVVVFDDQPIAELVAGEMSVLLPSVSDDTPGDDPALADIPMALAVVDIPGEGELGVSERRHVSIPVFFDDLHFINDTGVETATTAEQIVRKF